MRVRLRAVSISCALAWCAATGGARSGWASDFVDTRVNFNLTYENVFVDPGETNPSVPGLRIGAPNRLGILFFDNYDTRFTGFENLTHMVLYKAATAGPWDVEGAFVLRAQQSTNATGDVFFTDDGSYFRAAYFFDPTRARKTNLNVTAFPISGDRFRLGYSWRLSWGGTPIFGATRRDAGPAIKLQLSGERYYAFLGAKTSVVQDPVANEDEAVGAALAGFGVDVVPDLLRIEANAGFFDRGGNPKQEVLGEAVHTFGGAAQVSLRHGMPLGSSYDYRLYRNDPTTAQRFFERERYPGGLSWYAASEINWEGTTLSDPDLPGSTVVQPGLAADLNVRVKYWYWRLRLDAMVRDLAYILQDVPSFTPYEEFPSSVSTTPEYFVAAGIDRHFPRSGLTLGLTVGVDLPATFTAEALPPELQGNNPDPNLSQANTTVVVRSAADFDLLPPGEDALAIFASKLSARLDFAESFAALAEVLFSLDPNQARLERAGNEDAFVREFIDPELLGFNLSLQARS